MSFSKDARTAFANRAFVLSEMFNAKFRNTRFSGSCTRVVKVIPPETESTGGGKMARESIALVPESDNAGGSSIVCGWLDVGASTAQLRSYAALSGRHSQRFGNLPFDLDKGQYELFLGEANQFLLAEGITATLLEDGDATGETKNPVAAPAEKSQPGMQVVSANTSGATLQQSGGTSRSAAGLGLIIVGVLVVGIALGAAVVLAFVK